MQLENSVGMRTAAALHAAAMEASHWSTGGGGSTNQERGSSPTGLLGLDCRQSGTYSRPAQVCCTRQTASSLLIIANCLLIVPIMEK